MDRRLSHQEIIEFIEQQAAIERWNEHAGRGWQADDIGQMHLTQAKIYDQVAEILKTVLQ